MAEPPVAGIIKHFEGLPDPRTGNAKQHIFLEILIMAICAVICGADGWSDVELFAKNKKAWLKTFLKLPKGSPPMTPLGGYLRRSSQKSSRNALLNGFEPLKSSQSDK